ncbi:MAG TPA: UvrD-helicase domain-containing protein [Terrimicrobiaceae bacterium]|nr:UvrD-helicase domain-containing protein [Terrimicrobiaceae bacterium]
MKPLTHQRIIANAGSGKTYRLTTRYLELLAREVPAERIVALTFTRKAAGEFLDRIFERLLGGLSAGDAGSGLSAADCRMHLRQLIDKLPSLTLGTLDSFFGRMVRAFPFECGLAGELSLLDDHMQSVVRRDVLAGVFRGHLRDDAVFEEFLDLIRRQSRNSERRDVSGTLDREIQALHECFLMTPRERPWGDPAAIWPDGCRLLDGGGELADLVEAFAQELASRHGGMEEKHRAHWDARLAEIRALRPGSFVPEKPLAFALRSLRSAGTPKDGGFDLKAFGNKAFRFPDSARELVRALALAVIRIELQGHLDRSRALYELMARFEEPYQRQVRDAGRLTFLDITGLLAAAAGADWAGRSLRPFSRQEIDFRLDASYDHWLLDEFQDTSRLQWQALRNLIDEVVQSDTERRSFFYVGDTKQAIYTWRGGDPRLFDEVAAHYNASGTARIDTSEALDVSRRSVPEILDAVNAIFDPAALRAAAADFEFPEETLLRWESAWRAHRPHDPSPGRGFVTWRTLPAGDEDKKALLDEEAARIIRGIDPVARGLTCAVLVRSNDRILSVIEALRRAGLEARSEGRLFPCIDNDLGAALLALFRLAAHPDDALSRGHVGMTPFAALLADGEETFRLGTLRQIRMSGFAGVAAAWVDQFAPRDNAFAAARGRAFVRVAADFDAAYGAEGTIDEFTQFAEASAIPDSSSGDAVRVLTIHASKGLDFDMVVLPEIEGLVLPARRRDASIYLHADPAGRTDWGLELPAQDLCEADPTLRAAADAMLVDDCYQNLCVYYVAATRAKRGLYLLSSERPDTSKARDFHRLLGETLPLDEGVFQAGNPDWYEDDRREPSGAAPWEIPSFPPSARTEILPSAPSQAARRMTSGPVFARKAGRESGREAHAALAEIDWLEGGVPAGLPPLVAEFLATSAAAEVFRKPAGPFTLWREKAFDVLMDGRWVSGIFDRVVLHLDETGRPVRAELLDFKTEDAAAEPLTAMSRDQMNLYRRSLVLLTGLDQASISVLLVAVRGGRLIPL